MLYLIEQPDGDWINRDNGQVFNGVVPRDLNVGDRIQRLDGRVEEVTAKEITPEGAVMIRMVVVEDGTNG